MKGFTRCESCSSRASVGLLRSVQASFELRRTLGAAIQEAPSVPKENVMRVSERLRALGAPQNQERQAQMRSVAALAVLIVAIAAALPAASSGARERID